MRPFLARNTIFLPLLFLVLGIIFKEWTEIGWAVLIVISFFLVLLTYFYNNFKYLLFIPLGIAFASHPPPDPNSLELLTDKKADIEGTLFRPIERKERSSRLYVHIRQAFVDYQKHDIDLRVIVTIDDQLYGIYKGHRIRILGVKLKEFRNYENPGGFDVKKFYERKQIYLTGFIDNKSDIISFGQQSSLNFLRFIRANILRPNSEVYAALTIGEKKGIPFELRNNFSSLGISHLLAISGLHLGAIALIFYLIFDWLIKRSERLLLEYNVPKITAALTIVPIIFYMFLSGFATPVIRATI
ncbi:MAG: DUF4131 domain-containing protein, partial [Candidatus Dadabacteria bacterium]|nr:DUF4131 domain-containing protein [Candidatus Dadabacteria bacterium]NIT13651.1 DUF4131 domain-containing protein [Candidatus Dadabacteria bacterium]